MFSNYSVATAKAELEGILHGTTTNKIQNINGVFNRAARQLLLDIDPQETKRIIQMPNPIYDKVYDYALPSDLKGNKIIDIRPQVDRTFRDRFSQLYNQEFDLNKENFSSAFTMNFNSGIKTVRINAPFQQSGIVLNEVDNVVGNGTWVGDGAIITNLRNDNINYVSDSSCVQFDMVNGYGYVENSNMSAVDLSTHLNQSKIFLYVYLPVGADFAEVDVDWGNDNSNYYSGWASTTFDGNAFQNGWNLLSIDWAVGSGTPDPTNINFIQIYFDYTGSGTNGAKFDNIVSRMGEIMELEYYSKFLFRNASTGAFQETVLDDSDYINLDTESFNLFIALVALYCVQQSLGQDASFDTVQFENQYNNGLARYKAIYKSEVQKPITTYYQKPKVGWTRFFGRNY